MPGHRGIAERPRLRLPAGRALVNRSCTRGPLLPESEPRCQQTGQGAALPAPAPAALPLPIRRQPRPGPRHGPGHLRPDRGGEPRVSHRGTWRLVMSRKGQASARCRPCRELRGRLLIRWLQVQVLNDPLWAAQRAALTPRRPAAARPRPTAPAPDRASRPLALVARSNSSLRHRRSSAHRDGTRACRPNH
jgi:hypothetical protein